MSDNGAMPIDLPVDTTTAWTTVGGNATQNKAPTGTSGQSSKKSIQNGQAIGEIGNFSAPSTQLVPRLNPSLFVTRINFKVIPSREIDSISVPLSICRIITSIKAADKNARLIAVDEHDNEIEFTGSTDLQKNPEANIEYTNQFIDTPKMNKSNQLVGLIVLRSDMTFRDIKKHQLTQKGLNDTPRIYLTPNFLDVVNPTTVGFFVNAAPRADKPDTFTDRLEMFMNKNNTSGIKYQIEFGPIWAPKNRVSVFKLMTAFEDKEAARNIMEGFQAGPNEDTYVCMTEYGSLPDPQKIKIIRRQAEYAANHRSLFIEGYKSIHGKLRPGDEEDDSTDYESVAHWIYDRPTSYGQRMFTRVYGAVNGVVELHSTKDNIKEATDWARLANSEIGRLTNEEGMHAVFMHPEEALDAMESLPAWKPHSLSARIELLAEPAELTQTPRRNRRIVSIDYAKINKTKKANATTAAAKKQAKTRTTARNTSEHMPTNVNATHPAWCGFGPPSTMAKANMTNQDATYDTATPDTDDMEISTFTPATQTTSKQGVNKYKKAAEETEKRLWNIEESLIKLSDSQQQANTTMTNLSIAQRVNANKVNIAAESVDKLVKIVTDNKEDADDKYKAAAATMGKVAGQQDEAHSLMKAFTSSMQNMQLLMENMESRMKPLPESPVRKKQVNTFSAPPRTTIAPKAPTPPQNTWDKYYEVEGSLRVPTTTEDTNLNNYRSDAEMGGVAEEK